MEEGHFADVLGRKIKTFQWKPEGEVTALVYLCHGYAERLTPYYEELALEGNKRGFLCFGHDLIGHGQSEGEKVQAADMSDYVDPVVTHCTVVTEQYPGLPLFMVGHSMGGLITLLTVLKTQESQMFSGVVLMGPLIALDPAMASPIKVLLAKVGSRVWPGFSLGGIDPKLVTSDQAWIDKRTADTLMHHGGYKALHSHVLLTALKELESKYVEVKTPYLLLHGAEDKICSPEGSKKFHKLSTSEDKTLTLVESALHHLYLEKEEIRNQAIAATMDWVKQREQIKQ
eukprot:GFUD01013749.1.p1 GENE.GFUD01013749.1~~GFUD01013749.1.p1  ORF type:complete len:286 (-),score=81.53 GFUD01013749.1:72-929(-)